MLINAPELEIIAGIMILTLVLDSSSLETLGQGSNEQFSCQVVQGVPLIKYKNTK